MNIYGLRTNHLCNPLGFDLSPLRLSYKVQSDTAKKQTAAQIRLYDEHGAVIYDSTLREDIDSLCFMPLVSLTPRTRYSWDVKVCADNGEEAASPRAYFETGKMDEPWQAQWITSAHEFPSTRLFKQFSAQPVACARLYICGLGVYEAHINGRKAGDEYLAPGCNDYNSWLQYQTYDVTDLIESQNEISVLLGDGWYKGRFGFQGQKAVYGNQHALICELHLTYADGTHEVIATDNTWQVQEGPVRFSNIYDGEVLDPAFVPDAPEAAILLPDIGLDRLHERLSPPVRCMHTLKPERILTTPKGETVVDLGQIITGFLSFRDPGVKGRTYTLRYGEVLQEDCFYRDNLRTAQATYTYVSDGSGAWISPKFTFFGFRYVKLEGFDSAPDLSDFTGCVLYSDMEQTGFITTSNDKVNRFAMNALWGQRGNFLDVPTDCPQRDERMGWTGDAQAFCATALYQMDGAAFYTKFMHDMLMEQYAHEGGVPHVIPSFAMNCTPSCAWADAAAIIPWTLYTFYGDRAMLEKQYPNMREWVEWLRRLDDATGSQRLWHAGFHFADWLALDAAFKDSCRGGTDSHFIASCFYLYSTRLTAKAARVLGKADDAARYEQQEKEIRAAIRREYLTASGRLALSTQTAYILVLYLDIADESERPALRAALDRCFEDSRGELRTGFVGTSYLSRVLTHNRMNHRAYSLFLREDYPGWLYEVNMGATTVWERWNSILPNGRISDTGMNSLNHYAYGSVMEWLYRDGAGIAPLESHPGFRRVRMQPHPDARLPKVDFRFESPVGTYRSAWQITDDKTFTWTIDVPFGAEAEILLPHGHVTGLDMTEKDGGLYALVPAGHYELTCIADVSPWAPMLLDVPFAQLLSCKDTQKIIYEAAPDIDRIFLLKDPSTLTLRKLRDFSFSNLPPQQLRRLEDALSALCFA